MPKFQIPKGLDVGFGIWNVSFWNLEFATFNFGVSSGFGIWNLNIWDFNNYGTANQHIKPQQGIRQPDTAWHYECVDGE
jgi:hypothetical protein